MWGRDNGDGILFCLMTLASPLARQYYFVWLFFPLTILFHRAALDFRPKARAISRLALGASFALMALVTKALVERIIIAESNGDANARNKRSSATGAAQFVDDTWLEAIRRHRRDLMAISRA